MSNNIDELFSRYDFQSGLSRNQAEQLYAEMRELNDADFIVAWRQIGKASSNPSINFHNSIIMHPLTKTRMTTILRWNGDVVDQVVN